MSENFDLCIKCIHDYVHCGALERRYNSDGGVEKCSLFTTLAEATIAAPSDPITTKLDYEGACPACKTCYGFDDRAYLQSLGGDRGSIAIFAVKCPKCDHRFITWEGDE